MSLRILIILVLAVLGLSFTLMGAGFWTVDFVFGRYGAIAPSTVVGHQEKVYHLEHGLRTEYMPLIEFHNREGSLVRTNLDTPYSSLEKMPKTITVQYLHGKPNVVRDVKLSRENDLMKYLGLTLGPPMLIAAFALYYQWNNRDRSAIDLKKNGKRVVGKIIDVSTPLKSRFNWVWTYLVTVEWQDEGTGAPVQGESPLRFGSIDKDCVGKEVNVFVDPKDPSRFWVDLASVGSVHA